MIFASFVINKNGVTHYEQPLIISNIVNNLIKLFRGILCHPIKRSLCNFGNHLACNKDFHWSRHQRIQPFNNRLMLLHPCLTHIFIILFSLVDKIASFANKICFGLNVTAQKTKNNHKCRHYNTIDINSTHNSFLLVLFNLYLPVDLTTISPDGLVWTEILCIFI